MPVYDLQEQEDEPEEDQRVITMETISKLLLLRNIYKDVTKRPEDIYKPLGITRATFYRYAKILDNHTDEEIKNMGIKNNIK